MRQTIIMAKKTIGQAGQIDFNVKPGEFRLSLSPLFVVSANLADGLQRNNGNKWNQTNDFLLIGYPSTEC
ncbi:hypothetical protein Q31b_26170 [Novipirellula aureliae]|uniref:Uncharacterized protein n=1 Tax=Novipirellula aureliae TaxID=2527966 RepID=A0A5C6DX00_9BACT|nr:hypothetical protein Q31b_26170 [Novipirellula aureliae]